MKKKCDALKGVDANLNNNNNYYYNTLITGTAPKKEAV